MNLFDLIQQINRIERQAFGRTYRLDLFRNLEDFYLSSNCSCKNLKELVTLCYGKVTQNVLQARYIITECYRTDIDSNGPMQLHPNFILDSISAGKIEKLRKYVLK